MEGAPQAGAGMLQIVGRPMHAAPSSKACASAVEGVRVRLAHEARAAGATPLRYLSIIDAPLRFLLTTTAKSPH
jgi:hypothetical protein